MINTRTHNFIRTDTFEKDSSFYRWSSTEHSSEIRRFLSGEEVTLYADVNKASHDATKFKSLFLLVEAQNSKSDNETLNGLLEKFWVRLVYSGKSEYRFKDEIYAIDPYYNMKSDLILMQGYGCKHSCPSDNESYKMLSGNRPILSPCTLRKFATRLYKDWLKGGNIKKIHRKIHECILLLLLYFDILSLKLIIWKTTLSSALN